MILETRRLPLPCHKPPRLHKEALIMSFKHQWLIRKIYHEIIGLEGVDHFSINIVDTNGEMSIISYNPAIAYEIYQDGTYLYNGTISPTYYENMDFYTWDQCYDRRFYTSVKNSLQVKNGIDTGIAMVHRENGYNIIFSFASKSPSSGLLSNSIENSRQFMKMGFHCLDLIKEIYTEYNTDPNFQLIKQPEFIRPVNCLPNLRLIKG